MKEMVRYCMVWHGMVWYKVWYGMACADKDSFTRPHFILVTHTYSRLYWSLGDKPSSTNDGWCVLLIIRGSGRRGLMKSTRQAPHRVLKLTTAQPQFQLILLRLIIHLTASENHIAKILIIFHYNISSMR